MIIAKHVPTLVNEWLFLFFI